MNELSIASIAIALASAGFSIFTFFWTARRDRKRATLDAYNILQNEVFDKLNLYMPKEIEEIAAHPRSEEYKIISGYIARIEHFCVGVTSGIYDKNTVYKLAHGYFDSSVVLDRIMPIINRKQRGADEEYYANITEVVNWMKNKDNDSAKQATGKV